MHDDCKNDETLALLAQSCPRLRVLRIGKASLTAQGFATIANFSNLTELVIDQHFVFNAVMKASFLAVTTACPRLEKLQLSWSSGLDDHVVACLANCRYLRELSLVKSAWGRAEEAPPVLSEGIRALGRCCRLLSSLTIDSVVITDAIAAAELTHGCHFLRVVRFRSCHLSEEAMQVIVERCIYLETIDLKGWAGLGAFNLFLSRFGLADPTMPRQGQPKTKRPQQLQVKGLFRQ